VRRGLEGRDHGIGLPLTPCCAMLEGFSCDDECLIVQSACAKNELTQATTFRCLRPCPRTSPLPLRKCLHKYRRLHPNRTSPPLPRLVKEDRCVCVCVSNLEVSLRSSWNCIFGFILESFTGSIIHSCSRVFVTVKVNTVVKVNNMNKHPCI
jgi:hypothetical protein